MRPIVVQAGPALAASATLFFSGTPVSGTPLALSVTALDTPRRILLTYGVEAQARSLVITGKNWSGDAISETLIVPSGGGGTIASVLDYSSLTSAVPAGGGWSAAASLGTNTVVGSPWVRLDDYGDPHVNYFVAVSGTVNYTVQLSGDDPNLVAPQTPVLPAAMTWLPQSAGLTAQAVSAQGSDTAKALWARIVLNSFTNPGYARMTVTQAGNF